MPRPLESIVDSFLEDLDGLRQESNRVPFAWNDDIEDAVALKREGDYLGSAQVYIRLTREAGVVYSGLLRSLYKTVVCAGLLGRALRLSVIAKAIYDRSPDQLAVSAGIPSAFEEDIGELLAVSDTEPGLKAYLARMSGSPVHRTPREYESMIAELQDTVRDLGSLELSRIREEWSARQTGEAGWSVVPFDHQIRQTLNLANAVAARGDIAGAIRLYRQAIAEGIP
jgi:hypothetical protein